ncbi:MAG: right-handed parallel beta-helix repeat-containing protein, partial [Pyrinomonadaceae bacterium]|nr:right-handed parallel beta-helix repeat-containing protein [Sphingobacteriaceae bacterium]
MKLPLLKLLIFFSMFLALATVHAQDYYVSATGSNNNNGLTPSTPFATIQKAGDVVNPGGT